MHKFSFVKFIFWMVVLCGGAVAVLLGVPTIAESPRAATPAQSVPAAKARYDQLVITSSRFKKNQWGIVEGTLGLENLSDGDIKDMVFLYSAVAPSGTVIETRRATIYRLIPAHTQTVLSVTPAVPSQTDTVKFQVESYAH
jgi:hypothetical protein